MSKSKKPKPGPATHQHLDIAEIRDDIVLLKDSTVRAVLLVSSLNFSLKSEDEQEAIIQAYITFLNSLDFPIQIVIQSRRMNIDGYLASLKEQEKKTTNELLKAQINEYRSFVGELVEIGEIMQKRFYVVVPYDPLSDKQRGFFSRLGQAVSPTFAAKLSAEYWEKRKVQLSQRVASIAGALTSMGLSVVRLDTQSLIELYYTAYNPDLFETERLGDLGAVRIGE